MLCVGMGRDQLAVSGFGGFCLQEGFANTDDLKTPFIECLPL